MFQFKKNTQGLFLLTQHPHAEIINAFLQTDGDSFSDLIEEFLQDDTQNVFSGNVFQLTKQHRRLLLKDKISQQQIKMQLPLFITLFQQWLDNH